MGKIKALYSNSLALDGIKSRKRDSILTFRLVLIHSFLKSRSSSMWTPSSLMSSDLSMGRPSRLSPASIFLGLIFNRNWNLSGLADKKLFQYHVRACLLLVFSCCLTISWFVPFTCSWWSSAYMVMFPFSTCNGKSFWNMFQSKGPKDDPCRYPIACNFTQFYPVSSVFAKRSHQIERSTSKAISLQLHYCLRVTQTVEGLTHISR